MTGNPLNVALTRRVFPGARIVPARMAPRAAVELVRRISFPSRGERGLHDFGRRMTLGASRRLAE
jgi:hypothetical protein